MNHNKASGGSASLMLAIKGAYWVALLIIAAMALVSYLLMQQMLSRHQRDESLLALVSSQKALSQRIVFLAATIDATPAGSRKSIMEDLHKTTEQFERNYRRLAGRIGHGPKPSATRAGFAGVLYGLPYRLDYYSKSLMREGYLLASSGSKSDSSVTVTDTYRHERAGFDESLAKAALTGYTALEGRIYTRARSRLERTLRTHRLLFVATIVVIIIVVLLIFRPMTRMIARRTGELVQARNSMAFIAIHDGLTGLHNRSFVVDHFDELIKGAARRRERLAVLQIDLDRFKQINDTLGHAAGDFVLVKTAERMKASCRASDLCVRLGGDEFVVILGAVGTTDDINTVVQRILGRINEPMDFGGATILPGASGGVAVYPIDANNADDLLVHADLALYSAKRLGGGAFSFFSDELRKELEHRKQLERDLRTAIADDAFSVYYQPQISLVDSSVAGVEALARWSHPDRGMVAPGEFIPVAEKAGLMTRIGRSVMDKAIARAASWHRDGVVFGRLAVNVSGSELREPDFTDFLFDTLERHGLPAAKLSLEIVESVILDDEKTGIAGKLRAIRKAGVHLELDDFGTGYASLSHVNPNEIDRLKIDRRFVQNIDVNGDNSKIVRAITELARGLGIAIIAEGAETEAELDSLLALGCVNVQGFSVAYPMPEGEALDWLASRGKARSSSVAVLYHKKA